MSDSTAFQDALGSLMADGLQPSALALELGRKLVAGEITGDEAVRELVAHHGVAPIGEDPLQLLGEWMDWWSLDDRAPAKLPNALQVRSAVVLTARTEWTPPHRVDDDPT